jgi:hypothetical protein
MDLKELTAHLISIDHLGSNRLFDAYQSIPGSVKEKKVFLGNSSSDSLLSRSFALKGIAAVEENYSGKTIEELVNDAASDQVPSDLLSLALDESIRGQNEICAISKEFGTSSPDWDELNLIEQYHQVVGKAKFYRDIRLRGGGRQGVVAAILDLPAFKEQEDLDFRTETALEYVRSCTPIEFERIAELYEQLDSLPAPEQDYFLGLHPKDKDVLNGMLMDSYQVKASELTPKGLGYLDALRIERIGVSDFEH